MVSHLASLPGELAGIGIADFLEWDQRPTFILDLEDVAQGDDDSLRPVFHNSALRSSKTLLEIFSGANTSFHTSGSEGEAAISEFALWATDPRRDGLGKTEDSFLFLDFSWSCFTLHRRWRIIGGTHCKIDSKRTMLHQATQAPTAMPVSPNCRKWPDQLRSSVSTASQSRSSPRATWTDVLPKTDHVQFFKDTDWSKTPLGPLHSWSQGLCQIVCVLMSDSRPASLVW